VGPLNSIDGLWKVIKQVLQQQQQQQQQQQDILS
jgi:hypothetical protein